MACKDVNQAVRPGRSQQSALRMPREDYRSLAVMPSIDHEQWIHVSPSTSSPCGSLLSLLCAALCAVRPALASCPDSCLGLRHRPSMSRGNLEITFFLDFQRSSLDTRHPTTRRQGNLCECTSCPRTIAHNLREILLLPVR